MDGLDRDDDGTYALITLSEPTAPDVVGGEREPDAGPLPDASDDGDAAESVAVAVVFAPVRRWPPAGPARPWPNDHATQDPHGDAGRQHVLAARLLDPRAAVIDLAEHPLFESSSSRPPLQSRRARVHVTAGPLCRLLAADAPPTGPAARVLALTTSGVLHCVSLPGAAPGAAALAGLAPPHTSLPHHLGSMTSMDVAGHAPGPWSRLERPRALAIAGGCAAIGGETGLIVLVPLATFSASDGRGGAPPPGAGVCELRGSTTGSEGPPAGGLLGGFIARAGALMGAKCSPVVSLTPCGVGGGHLLVAHQDGTLAVWDVGRRVRVMSRCLRCGGTLPAARVMPWQPQLPSVMTCSGGDEPGMHWIVTVCSAPRFVSPASPEPDAIGVYSLHPPGGGSPDWRLVLMGEVPAPVGGPVIDVAVAGGRLVALTCVGDDGRHVVTCRHLPGGERGDNDSHWRPCGGPGATLGEAWTESVTAPGMNAVGAASTDGPADAAAVAAAWLPAVATGAQGTFPVAPPPPPVGWSPGLIHGLESLTPTEAEAASCAAALMTGGGALSPCTVSLTEALTALGRPPGEGTSLLSHAAKAAKSLASGGGAAALWRAWGVIGRAYVIAWTRRHGPLALWMGGGAVGGVGRAAVSVGVVAPPHTPPPAVDAPETAVILSLVRSLSRRVGPLALSSFASLASRGANPVGPVATALAALATTGRPGEMLPAAVAATGGTAVVVAAAPVVSPVTTAAARVWAARCGATMASLRRPAEAFHAAVAALGPPVCGGTDGGGDASMGDGDDDTTGHAPAVAAGAARASASSRRDSLTSLCALVSHVTWRRGAAGASPRDRLSADGIAALGDAATASAGAWAGAHLALLLLSIPARDTAVAPGGGALTARLETALRLTSTGPAVLVPTAGVDRWGIACGEHHGGVASHHEQIWVTPVALALGPAPRGGGAEWERRLTGTGGPGALAHHLVDVCSGLYARGQSGAMPALLRAAGADTNGPWGGGVRPPALHFLRGLAACSALCGAAGDARAAVVATRCFAAAAGGAATGDPTLWSLLTPLRTALHGGPPPTPPAGDAPRRLVQYHETLSLLFDRLGASAAAAAAAASAISTLDTVEPHHGDDAASSAGERHETECRLTAAAFSAAVASRAWAAAYAASVSSAGTGLVPLLVGALCDAGDATAMNHVLTLPWVGHLPTVEDVLRRRSRAADPGSTTGDAADAALMSLAISRGNARSAATIAMGRARRLLAAADAAAAPLRGGVGAPTHPAPRVLVASAAASLLTSLSCLRLVTPTTSAWVDGAGMPPSPRPPPSPFKRLRASPATDGTASSAVAPATAMSGAPYPPPVVVITLRDVGREYLLTAARLELADAYGGSMGSTAPIAVGSRRPAIDSGGVPPPLGSYAAAQALLAVGRTQAALGLVGAAKTSRRRKTIVAAVVAHLAARCASEAAGGGGTIRVAAAADGPPALGASSLLGEWGGPSTTACATAHLAAAGDRAVIGGGAVDDAWAELRDCLDRWCGPGCTWATDDGDDLTGDDGGDDDDDGGGDGGGEGDSSGGLPAVAAAALLAGGPPGAPLPLWLTDRFAPAWAGSMAGGGGGGDPGALARLYLRVGRPADAARWLLGWMDRAGRVGVLERIRPAASWWAYGLMCAVDNALGAVGGEGSEALRTRLRAAATARAATAASDSVIIAAKP